MQTTNGGVAVITGGASGLGKAIAQEAASRGMKLVLADVETEALEAAVAAIREAGAEAIGVFTNVADAAAVDALAERTLDEYGPATLLFNNAGVTSGGFIWENTKDDWTWLMGVNVDGVANGVRAFTPQMLNAAAANANYRGCIVNTASLAGLLTGPAMGIYSVSKHAVVALSECLYHDLSIATSQVTTAVLCPSYVSTNIGQSHRNRPAELASTQRLTASQIATRQTAQRSLDNGTMSAAQVAAFTFAAIETDTFYIFPDAEPLPVVEARMANILRQANPDFPYDQVPSMKDRRDALLAAL